MNRDNALLVANIVDKITKLEKTIFDLEDLKNKDSFTITAFDSMSPLEVWSVNLNSNEIATAVFSQDILELYVNTLNLELNELVKSLEEF